VHLDCGLGGEVDEGRAGRKSRDDTWGKLAAQKRTARNGCTTAGYKIFAVLAEVLGGGANQIGSKVGTPFQSMQAQVLAQSTNAREVPARSQALS
jgi:hypothetical protein